MFSLLHFETNSPKNEKTFFKKLEYRFLVQSTNIESTSFPHKTALPEANVKTNRIEWEVQYWFVTKDGVLPVTTLFFWKFYFRMRTSSKKLIRCTNYPNVHIYTFCKRWSFIWRCFFPASILKYEKLIYVLNQKKNSNTKNVLVSNTNVTYFATNGTP